jgi:hypothetical protein
LHRIRFCSCGLCNWRAWRVEGVIQRLMLNESRKLEISILSVPPTATSLDHLVGTGEQCRGQLDSHRASRTEIDVEYEFCGTFEGQVTWLFTFQDPINLQDQAPTSFG